MVKCSLIGAALGWRTTGLRLRGTTWLGFVTTVLGLVTTFLGFVRALVMLVVKFLELGSALFRGHALGVFTFTVVFTVFAF